MTEYDELIDRGIIGDLEWDARCDALEIELNQIGLLIEKRRAQQATAITKDTMNRVFKPS